MGIALSSFSSFSLSQGMSIVDSSRIASDSVSILISVFVALLGVPGGDAPTDPTLVGVASEGLGARMIGTDAGLTLSASDPNCVGELLRLVSDGSGGCNTTQTCWVEGGDMTLGVTLGVTACVTLGGGLFGRLFSFSDTREKQIAV